MNYVEWLRVRNALRVARYHLGYPSRTRRRAPRLGFAIHVPVVLGTSHLARTWNARDRCNSVRRYQAQILDNPDKQENVVIDDRGNAGTHIVVTEPTKQAHKEHDKVNVGSIQVMESHHGKMTTTVIDTNGAVPMIYYMAIADVFALIIATILAAPLAREIDGHLEVTLTKPISRLRYALGAVGADIVGILAASLMTIVAFYLCQLLFETPRLDFSGINTRAILMGIAAPLAWYAMLLAATTWFARSYAALWDSRGRSCSSSVCSRSCRRTTSSRSSYTTSRGCSRDSIR